MAKIKSSFHNVERIGATVFDHSSVSPEGISEQGQVIVDLIKKAPPLVDFEPHVVRSMRQAAGNPFEHEDVATVVKTDIEVPGEVGTLPARMYTPALTQKNNLPSVVYFHGGGFVLGNIESYDRICTQLAHQSGVVVISVEYRLAPETMFPGGLLDAQIAFNWIMENAASLHLDPKKMAVGGDSAGANIAAVICLLNRNEKRPMPAFQLLVYPWTAGNDSSPSRERLIDAAVIPKLVLEWFLKHYVANASIDDLRFNLLVEDDLSELPSAFVLTAGYDPLLDEGDAYTKKLKLHGGEVRYSCYADMFHGFLNYGTLPQSQAALSECAAVLACVLID